jgi:hypothetical protein
MLAPAIVGSVLVVLAFTRGGSSAGHDVPAGFHVVNARGPVEHAVIEQRSFEQLKNLDLASGRERLTKSTLDVWWDPKSGLVRVVGRTDGRVGF